MIPYSDNLGPRRFPVLTILIVLCWGGLHAWFWTLDQPHCRRVETRFGLVSGWVHAACERLGDGGLGASTDSLLTLIVRMLAYPWIHFGIVGAVTNSIILLAFGARLESRVGWLRFAIVWVLWGIVVGIAEVVFFPARNVPVVGGGGCCAALIAAFLSLYPKARIRVMVPAVVVPVFAAIPAVVLALGWVVLQYAPVQCLLALGDDAPLGYSSLGLGAIAGLLTAPMLRERETR